MVCLPRIVHISRFDIPVLLHCSWYAYTTRIPQVIITGKRVQVTQMPDGDTLFLVRLKYVTWYTLRALEANEQQHDHTTCRSLQVLLL